MKGRFLLLLLILALAVPVRPVAGQEPPGHYLDFARHLFDEGDYFRSITEAKRFIFLSPQDPQRVEAELLIARALYQAGQYREAREAFRPVFAQTGRPDLAAQALLELGRCLEALDSGRDAVAYYQGLTTEPALPAGHEPEIRNTAWYRLGWLLLEAGRWRESREAFDRVEKNHELKASAVDLARRAPEGLGLDYRSPAAAGVLSGILPGAGQVYTGRPVDAGLAFTLNAAFLYGALEAYHDENWGVFALLGLMEIGWYGGNIYNAVNGAHIHNREEKDRFLRRIKRDHGWRLGGDPVGRGLVLSWTLDY
ncbi:MAG: tetratricopeptide repeat protein [Thermodesulfobacteriota bacterium]